MSTTGDPGLVVLATARRPWPLASKTGGLGAGVMVMIAGMILAGWFPPAVGCAVAGVCAVTAFAIWLNGQTERGVHQLTLPMLAVLAIAVLEAASIIAANLHWSQYVEAGSDILASVLTAVLIDRIFYDFDPARRRRHYADGRIIVAVTFATAVTLIPSLHDNPSPAANGTLIAACLVGGTVLNVAGAETRWRWNGALILAAGASTAVFDVWLRVNGDAPEKVGYVMLIVPWAMALVAICHPGVFLLHTWSRPRRVSLRTMPIVMSIAAVCGVWAIVVGARHGQAMPVIAGVVCLVALCAHGIGASVDGFRALRTAEDLHAQVAQVRTEERERLARALHDNVLQQLVALRWASFGAEADELDDKLETAIRAARSFLNGLATPPPGWQQLSSSVTTLSAALGGTIEWHVTVHRSMLPLSRLGPTVWAVVREGVANTVKHSGAEHGYVWVGILDGNCQIRVSDDGHREGVAPRRGQGAGVGLGQLRLLLDQVGGTVSLEITSAGTTLQAEIPVRAASN